MDFPGHFQHVFKQLNHQRLHAQLCDCLVVVGGQSFRAHSSILAACSSHFRALLSSGDGGDEVGGARADGAGGGGPGVMELDPEVVTPEAFSTLLDMIYTSTLSLGASNVMDVLLAASHLHLNAVVKACKLHLSRKNFPASPPKGWRSVQQQQQQQQRPPSQAERSASLEEVTSAMEEDLEGVGAVVSQSGGVENQGVRRRASGEQGAAATSSRQKRKSSGDRPDGRKRSCGPPGDDYKECSPTVTSRGTVSAEEGGEDLLSPDCLRSTEALWERRGHGEEEEVEEKYEAGKGESEEIQLPSQSDGGTGGVGADGDTVVKVKVGEEGEEEEEEGGEAKMAVVEVKKENLSAYSPDLDSPPSPLPPQPPPPQDSADHLNAQANEEKAGAASSPAGSGAGSLRLQLCADLHAGIHREAGGLGGDGDSVDGEGLDSLSELALSCFLNPGAESVMGALEEEDSLASLTAAATAAAAAAAAASGAPAGNMDELCQNTEEANASSAHTSDPSSSSSLVFPVASVPLQQLLPTQSPGFSDALILQPAQNSIAGFLSGVRPGLGLEASLVQPPRVGKGSGATTFRRIAPKVPPGSEAGADPSCGPAGDASSAAAAAADRPPLTRASEDVLSKCKKAAAEDHVLLVEGEKKYACSICCKTFMNLTDCKKHIRVHTGEKPYPCPRCGKRFSQSSHLYKHSKNTCLSWKDEQAFPDALL